LTRVYPFNSLLDLGRLTIGKFSDVKHKTKKHTKQIKYVFYRCFLLFIDILNINICFSVIYI